MKETCDILFAAVRNALTNTNKESAFFHPNRLEPLFLYLLLVCISFLEKYRTTDIVPIIPSVSPMSKPIPTSTMVFHQKTHLAWKAVILKGEP